MSTWALTEALCGVCGERISWRHCGACDGAGLSGDGDTLCAACDGHGGKYRCLKCPSIVTAYPDNPATTATSHHSGRFAEFGIGHDYGD